MNKINETLTLPGEIVTGRGTGRNRMTSLAPFFEEHKLNIYPGTLNVVFSKPIGLDKFKADLVYNSNYFFWKIKINGIDCFAYRWGHCPDHIIEIVANVKLRDKINIDELEIVIIEIDKSVLRPLSFGELTFWNFVWKGRTKAYYTNDLYAKIVSKFLNLSYRIKNLAPKTN